MGFYPMGDVYDRMRVLYSSLRKLQEYDRCFPFEGLIKDTKLEIRKLRDHFVNDTSIRTSRRQRMDQLILQQTINKCDNVEAKKLLCDMYCLLYDEEAA